MFNSSEATSAPSRPRQGSTISLMDTALSNAPPRSPTEPRPASAPIDIVSPSSAEAHTQTPPSVEVEPGSPPKAEDSKLKNFNQPLSARYFSLFSKTPAKPVAVGAPVQELDDSMETEEVAQGLFSQNSNAADKRHAQDELADDVFNFEP